MLLRDLQLPGQDPGHRYQLAVHDGRILSVEDDEKAAGIPLDGAMLYPGFINSHDHLDFNLFSPTANGVYPSYREWGRDIHLHNKTYLDMVMKVPIAIRTQWGLYKNLLGGFTTVVNHGSYLPIENPLISVYQDAQSLHSPGFERGWKWKLNNPERYRQEVAIHVGEGTNAASHAEIDQLTRWNITGRRLIGIHGVAMTTKQAAHFSGLVWCPASNYFLLNKTAEVNKLKAYVPIVFGSDSTLTSPWNIWEHLQNLPADDRLSSEELLAAVTSTAASIWKLNDRATITPGKRADITIIKSKHAGQALPQATEEIMLVLHKGKVVMIDEIWYDRFPAGSIDLTAFTKIRAGSSHKYIVGNLHELARQTILAYPSIDLPVTII